MDEVQRLSSALSFVGQARRLPSGPEGWQAWSARPTVGLDGDRIPFVECPHDWCGGKTSLPILLNARHRASLRHVMHGPFARMRFRRDDALAL